MTLEEQKKLVADSLKVPVDNIVAKKVSIGYVFWEKGKKLPAFNVIDGHLLPVPVN